jgi:hypothetical protein
MRDVKNEADGISTHGRDAVEWFVENESDRELNEDTVLEWEEWCTHVWNKAAYVGIAQMRQQLPLLSAPTFASREDLLRDALAESGPES